MGSASILISLRLIPVEDFDWISVREDISGLLVGFLLRSGGNHSLSWYISCISYSESSELDPSEELELVELADEEEDEVNDAAAAGIGLLS